MVSIENNFPNHFVMINNNKHPCRAGGILPYTIINNKLYFLLQKSDFKRNLFSDFGGKREDDDLNIMYTAAREFSEETNGLFFSNNLYQKNKPNIKKSTIITSSLLEYNSPLFIYNYNGKYIIYLLRIYPISTNKFGNIEFFTNMKRICTWVDGSLLKNDNYINNHLQYRMRRGLKKTISKLYENLYKNQELL